MSFVSNVNDASIVDIVNKSINRVKSVEENINSSIIWLDKLFTEYNEVEKQNEAIIGRLASRTENNIQKMENINIFSDNIENTKLVVNSSNQMKSKNRVDVNNRVGSILLTTIATAAAIGTVVKKLANKQIKNNGTYGNYYYYGAGSNYKTASEISYLERMMRLNLILARSFMSKVNKIVNNKPKGLGYKDGKFYVDDTKKEEVRLYYGSWRIVEKVYFQDMINGSYTEEHITGYYYSSYDNFEENIPIGIEYRDGAYYDLKTNKKLDIPNKAFPGHFYYENGVFYKDSSKKQEIIAYNDDWYYAESVNYPGGVQKIPQKKYDRTMENDFELAGYYLFKGLIKKPIKIASVIASKIQYYLMGNKEVYKTGNNLEDKFNSITQDYENSEDMQEKSEKSYSIKIGDDFSKVFEDFGALAYDLFTKKIFSKIGTLGIEGKIVSIALPIDYLALESNYEGNKSYERVKETDYYKGKKAKEKIELEKKYGKEKADVLGEWDDLDERIDYVVGYTVPRTFFGAIPSVTKEAEALKDFQFAISTGSGVAKDAYSAIFEDFYSGKRDIPKYAKDASKKVVTSYIENEVDGTKGKVISTLFKNPAIDRFYN